MNCKQRRGAGEPSKAEVDRITDQLEAAGCPRCGSRFGTGIPYLIGKIKAGWAGRCMRCTDDLLPTAPFFIGTGIFHGDPWVLDDRDWFRANPRRQWRLRWPMRGEVETLAADEELAELAAAPRKVPGHARAALRYREQGGSIAIAVSQLAPGKRLRVPFAVPSNLPLESLTDAGVAAFLPFLVRIADLHSAAVGSDAAAKEMFEAQLRRRLEAVAKIIGVQPRRGPTP